MEHNHRKSSFGKAFVMLLIVGLIVLVVMLDARRRQVENQLSEMMVRVEQANPQADRIAAQKVVEKVRQLIRIPNDVEPTVATIVDVDQLKQRNAFYAKAKNGDNLIVTPDRAILFDPVANVILDVVPVSIQAPTAKSAAPSSAGRASAVR
jgi:hypothetical protein